MISLKRAGEFHGHLGPYLVLGLLMGGLALKKLKAKKYFGIKVKVWGATKKPKSCLIDGLQLATGCTYGKGNIQRLNGKKIVVIFCNLDNNRKMILTLKNGLIRRLDNTRTHRASERLARLLYKAPATQLFNIKHQSG